MRSGWVVLMAVALVLAGCGEPDVDLALPERAEGQQVLDEADLLDSGVLVERLSALRDDGHDVVAVTFESPDASAGHADRGGRLVLGQWGADVVLIAVAEPGDFTSSDDEARRRFFGVVPADRFAVSGDVREEIVEQIAPPLAAENDWPALFLAALDAVEGELRR